MGNENDFVNYPRMVSGFWVFTPAAANVAERGLDPKTTPPTQEFNLPLKNNVVNAGINNHFSSNLNSVINELSPNNVNNMKTLHDDTKSYTGGFKLPNTSGVDIIG